jgi:hypothetical protein
MNWFNLYTPFLRSAEYVGSEPVVRSTWISIVCYCCEQENDGLIIGAGNWKDRQWQQTCGVTLAEIQMESRLWKWCGSNLEVVAYPHDKQREVIAKRRAGQIGGKLSAAIRSAKAELKAKSKHSLKQNGKHISTEGEGEGEDKGKRYELRHTLSTISASK